MNKKNTKKLEKRLILNECKSYISMCDYLKSFKELPEIVSNYEKKFTKKIIKFRKRFGIE